MDFWITNYWPLSYLDFWSFTEVYGQGVGNQDATQNRLVKIYHFTFDSF